MYYTVLLCGTIGTELYRITLFDSGRNILDRERTYFHGICAATGKFGALIVAVVFHFTSQHQQQHQHRQEYLFYISGTASFLAALVTHWFIPETSGLDLLELDVQWKLILLLEG